MRYDSRGGAKAIRYCVNIKNREKMPISCVALKKVSKRIFNKKNNEEQKCRVAGSCLLIALLFL